MQFLLLQGSYVMNPSGLGDTEVGEAVLPFKTGQRHFFAWLRGRRLDCLHIFCAAPV
jgi:hypothetical protein